MITALLLVIEPEQVFVLVGNHHSFHLLSSALKLRHFEHLFWHALVGVYSVTGAAAGFNRNKIGFLGVWAHVHLDRRRWTNGVAVICERFILALGVSLSWSRSLGNQGALCRLYLLFLRHLGPYFVSSPSYLCLTVVPKYVILKHPVLVLDLLQLPMVGILPHRHLGRDLRSIITSKPLPRQHLLDKGIVDRISRRELGHVCLHYSNLKVFKLGQ